MKKNIKDYIHLYLGCEVKTNKYGIGLLDSVSKTCIHIEFEKTIQGFLFGEDVKLILRPLSDITKEENEELTKFKHHQLRGFVCIDEELHEYLLNGELHKYLLKKRFDLFGLIEDGLALDKTKIIQKN